MARILGATYGRLQSELLSPLVTRARNILTRRGEIPDLPLDNRRVALEYKSRQARYQAQQDVQNTLVWLDAVRALGPEALAAVDQAAAARWLGRTLGVPGELIREDSAVAEQLDVVAAGAPPMSSRAIEALAADDAMALPTPIVKPAVVRPE
jgi:hypothetical protein